jgi:hypothetical protein
MAEENEVPDDNPFRAYSARNVLARAKERLQLARHWLIRHEPERRSAEPSPPSAQDKPADTE